MNPGFDLRLKSMRRALTTVMKPAAIAPLLEIASTTSNKVHKVLCLRAVTAVARLRETPRPEALAALTKVLELADNAEKSQALAALGDIPTVESLKLLVQNVETAGLSDSAGSAILKIAPAVVKQDKALTRTALEKTVANVKSARTKDAAQKLLDGIK